MSITKPKAHTYITDLHFDHVEWVNALSFYKDELGIFENRLEDIVRRNNKHEVMAGLKHFQNQFIREKEEIDELRHDIQVHEQLLEMEAKEHPVAVEHRYFTDHTDLRDRYQTFEKLYRDLKTEFHQWLAKRL